MRGRRWRYFKAYLADRLDGEWTPIAATKDKNFASMANTRPIGERWADSISHGEWIRSGIDERMAVDPTNLRFVFQGVSNRERAGKSYREIPWRLGMLETGERLTLLCYQLPRTELPCKMDLRRRKRHQSAALRAAATHGTRE